jgi:hypothetical protein
MQAAERSGYCAMDRSFTKANGVFVKPAGKRIHCSHPGAHQGFQEIKKAFKLSDAMLAMFG